MARFVIVFFAFLVLIWGCEEKSSTSPVAQESKQYTAEDVADALIEARNFRNEGKYEKALERHLWYHKNAPTYAPAEAGVRLSFALSDWMELGKVYPKALEELRQVRDEALARYRKDPKDELLYGEVLSLDLALEDFSSAKSLFYEGRKTGIPDRGLLSLKLSEILATGDKDWAKDVLGDPDEKLMQLEEQRKMITASIKANPPREGMGDMPDQVFTSQATMLIRNVNAIRGEAKAKKIQTRALKTVNSAEIRDALKG